MSFFLPDFKCCVCPPTWTWVSSLGACPLPHGAEYRLRCHSGWACHLLWTTDKSKCGPSRRLERSLAIGLDLSSCSLYPWDHHTLLAHRKWEPTPCRDVHPWNQPTCQSPEIWIQSHEAILTQLHCQLTAETHQASPDPMNSPLTHRIVRNNVSCLLFETAKFWSRLLHSKG